MATPKLTTAQTDAFDRILSEAVSSKTSGGVFFGVTTADEAVYIRTAGTKLIDDPASGAVNEDTVFWLCSQTKLITSIAALQLIEQGKIALDTPVESVLPELANAVVITARDDKGRPTSTVPAKEKILFGHLLNHSSGLDYNYDWTTPPGGMPLAYSHSYGAGEDVSTFLNFLKGPLPNVALKFEPGTDFAYGFSSDCAGFVVERLSGKSLEQYFQDHIFAPLGITSASFYLTPELKDRLLPLAYRTKSGVIENWKGPSPIDHDPAHRRVHMGGVGLYASEKDYLTLLRHLLQIKAGRATNPILSRASVDSMFTPTLPAAGLASLGVMAPYAGLPATGVDFGRGLCVNTVDMPGKRNEGSGTWGGWASTSFFIDPTAGLAAVVGNQVVPTGDAEHRRLCDALERVLYKADVK
ncbi:beta-lactamase/transpeptidase-like protein [Mycena polygramma]|nr:beta-lactamase/transpeptidase-like protein [Mycena polygramma]